MPGSRRTNAVLIAGVDDEAVVEYVLAPDIDADDGPGQAEAAREHLRRRLRRQAFAAQHAVKVGKKHVNEPRVRRVTQIGVGVEHFWFPGADCAGCDSANSPGFMMEPVVNR